MLKFIKQLKHLVWIKWQNIVTMFLWHQLNIHESWWMNHTNANHPIRQCLIFLTLSANTTIKMKPNEKRKNLMIFATHQHLLNFLFNATLWLQGLIGSESLIEIRKCKRVTDLSMSWCSVQISLALTLSRPVFI